MAAKKPHTRESHPEEFHENFRLIPHPEYEDIVEQYENASGVVKFGARCGRRDCAYATGEWDTEEQAAARIAQHRDEHETGRIMQPLEEFEAANGYERTGA